MFVAGLLDVDATRAGGIARRGVHQVLGCAMLLMFAVGACATTKPTEAEPAKAVHRLVGQLVDVGMSLGCPESAPAPRTYCLHGRGSPLDAAAIVRRQLTTSSAPTCIGSLPSVCQLTGEASGTRVSITVARPFVHRPQIYQVVIIAPALDR